MVNSGVVKGVVFYIKDHANNQLPDDVFGLMKDFRLMVNETIRAGILNKVTSRFALCKIVYKGLRKDYDVYAQYIPSACEVAGSHLKNYRKQKRKNPNTKTPYVTHLSLKAENQTYKLDRKTGMVRLPIKAGKHVDIELTVSKYHRQYLDDETLVLGSLTITPRKLVIAFRKKNITPIVPQTILALDTNERSLDGVFVEPSGPVAVRLDLSEASVIQERHTERRSHLQKKKPYDKRTRDRLCKREGKREHDRVEDRFKKAALMIVWIALMKSSVIVLEDLTGLRMKSWSKKLNRRMSAWPRRRLHELIIQTARWYGIPVILVDPRFTSTNCPICGRKNLNSRMDRMFRCVCGWECDKHINAGLNIMIKAAALYEDVARVLKGGPDASWHDLMKSRYDLMTGARTEGNRMSGTVGA